MAQRRPPPSRIALPGPDLLRNLDRRPPISAARHAAYTVAVGHVSYDGHILQRPGQLTLPRNGGDPVGIS